MVSRIAVCLLLLGLAAAVVQPTPLHVANHSIAPASSCTSLEADLTRLLSNVRGRVGERRTWLANWFVPTQLDWDLARRAAAVHAAAGCSPFAVVSHAHNLRLALSPCVTQCEAVADSLLPSCWCRACNSTSARPSFELLVRECATRESPLLPYLNAGLCDRLRGVQARLSGAWSGGGSGRSAGAGCDQMPSEYEAPPTLSAHKGEPATAPLALPSASACMTMFGEPCCPESRAGMAEHSPEHGQAPERGLVCGGEARGVCVPIDRFVALSRSWRPIHGPIRSDPIHGRDGQAEGGHAPPGDCEWPRRYAAARCLCRPRYAGSSCDGCAAGWQGRDCSEVRSKEVRRDLASLSAAERADFFGKLRLASSTLEWKAMEASHEFGLSLYHETSHLLFSHHAYFGAMTEVLRRKSGAYDTPLPYFLPTNYGHVKLVNAMHPHCLDCRVAPPASWSVAQVAKQVVLSPSCLLRIASDSV